MCPKNPAPETSLELGDWLSYLEQLHSQEIELGLDRVLVVYRRLLPGGLSGRTVIVGGTNGKGSTVHALEQLLLLEDCRTGAYSSPHIHRFNERVRICGEEVDDAALCRAMAAVEEARGEVSLTYFEFTTLAAFWLFQQAGVVFPLLEVGLGGRLDAVNIVEPELAIITSVDLDHTQWLGEDRDRIGYEKAGILRAGQPAIFGDPDPPASVVRQARAQDVLLRLRGRDFGCGEGVDGDYVLLDTNAGSETVAIQGQIPSPAQQVALQAFRDLGFPVSENRIQWLVNSTRLPGRFERRGGAAEVVLDVGHNPHAATWLARQLAALPAARQVLAVYAALSDKDVEGVVAALRESVDQWFLAGLGGDRGLPCGQLADRLLKILPEAHQLAHPDVRTALDAALERAGQGDRVLVFGSFHTVAEASSVLESLASGADTGGELHSQH